MGRDGELNFSTTQVSSERFSSLDGVRGLAALSVVVTHLISVFLSTSYLRYAWFDHAIHIASYTPLAAVWAGSQAVMVFFILSGFALHRMLLSGTMNYGSYLVRRIVRLWVPYAVVLILTIAGIVIFGSHKIAGQSAWLNTFLNPTLSKGLLIQHFLMVGVFDTRPINFVIWSLVHEMRLSLVFPLIFWAVERNSPWKLLIISVFIGFIADFIGHHSVQPHTGIVSTFYYQTFFVIGALLSKHSFKVIKIYRFIPKEISILLFVFFISMYCNCFRISATYCEMFGAIWVLITGLSSQTAGTVLNSPVVQWLGKISYSLYLCHAVILIFMVNLLYPTLPFTEVVLISIPIIFIVSVILNYLVEQPSIFLSRKLGKGVTGIKNPNGLIRLRYLASSGFINARVKLNYLLL